MTKCATCKRAPTQKRKLDQNNICTECRDEEKEETFNQANIDDSKPMGDITFGEFRSWFKGELNALVRKVVQEELQETRFELEKLQKDHKELKTRVTQFESRFEEKAKKIEKDISENTENFKKLNTVTNNNLKYLINFDRDRRKHNLVLFGVKEDEPLEINDTTATTDVQKTKLLLVDFLQCPDVKIVDMFRLGKEVSDKPRPIKLTFATKNMAFSLLAKTKIRNLKIWQLATT